MERIYLDHAATTPVAPEVVSAMLPWFEDFGNPSSLYFEGRRARQAIDQAREVLASRLGCLFGEVHFTSSGTESCNLALIGCARAALANGSGRRRILVPASEHHAILHTAPFLAALGFRLEVVPVDQFGRVQLKALAEALGDDVLLVSVMTANNELGSLSPVVEASRLARRVGALMHTDAVQSFGLDQRTVDELECDLLTASAHKLYGPKGVGLLYVRSGAPVLPVMTGGGQERELRAGTENVAGIVGFGGGVSHCVPGTASARNSFLKNLSSKAQPTVPREIPSLSSHAHVRFPDIHADTLLIKLDRLGISANSGAACSSGSIEPSHVLLACGYSSSEAAECIRFSFGRGQDDRLGARAAELVNDVIS